MNPEQYGQKGGAFHWHVMSYGMSDLYYNGVSCV